MRIPMPRRKRTRVLITVFGVLVLAAGGAWYVQSGGSSPTQVAHASDATDDEASDEEEDVDRVPVELALAERVDLPSLFQATGTLTAERTIDLTAKVGGQITALRVEEGDWVKSGQVLLELDHREQKLLVEEARVRSETAKLELERMQNMAERGLETDRKLEEAKQAYEVNQAQYELAKVRLSDHIVRAPFAGRVTTRQVELGATIQAGASMIGLADTSPMKVELFLPERVVTRLQKGQPVQVHPDVAPDETLVGSVERIAPVVDASTSTVKVTLRVDDAGESARSGSFVRCNITTDVRQAVVAVPKKALVAEAGATYLFVAEADSVRKLAIETGYHDADRIEVLDGVADGDQVVVVGQGGLRQGSRIEVLPGPDAAREDDADDGTALARN